MTPDPKFTAQVLTLADGLRRLRATLNRKLLLSDEIAPAMMSCVSVILCDGALVAEALHQLAAQLGEAGA